MPVFDLPKEQVAQLKMFVEACKFNPDILHMPELSFFKTFIESTGGKIPPKRSPSEPGKTEKDTPTFATNNQASTPEPEDEPMSDESEVDLDNSGVIEDNDEPNQAMGDIGKEVNEEDEDMADSKKSEAVGAIADGDYEKAVSLFTDAIMLNPESALLYAKRGQCYLRLQKPKACIKDCERALELNSDSAAAHKFKGRAHRLLGQWEEAAMHLRTACKIDFDEQADEWLKEVTPNAKKIEEHKRKYERKHEERELKQRMERIRRAKEERAKAQAEEDARRAAMGGSDDDDDGDFLPGGAGGKVPPNFANLFSDPELMSAFKDPEVMAAFADITSNPANAAKYQSNPKVAALIAKLSSKMGGGAGGGFPGAGGPGGFPFGGGPPGAGSATGGSPPSFTPKAPSSDDLD